MHEGALAVAERVGGDADVGRHDRQTRGHRFDEREAEAFVVARKHEDVGGAVEIDELRVIDARPHGDAGPDVLGKRRGDLVGTGERPGADEAKPRVAPREIRERGGEGLGALHPEPLRDDEQRAHGPRLAGGPEEAVRDAMRDGSRCAPARPIPRQSESRARCRSGTSRAPRRGTRCAGRTASAVPAGTGSAATARRSTRRQPRARRDTSARGRGTRRRQEHGRPRASRSPATPRSCGRRPGPASALRGASTSRSSTDRRWASGGRRRVPEKARPRTSRSTRRGRAARAPARASDTRCRRRSADPWASGARSRCAWASESARPRRDGGCAHRPRAHWRSQYATSSRAARSMSASDGR